MPDPCSVYVDVQQRIIAMVRSLDDDALRTVVPACPAWTVRDVLAHVTAGVADSVTGNVPELAGVALMDHWKDERAHAALESMLARQLEERRRSSRDELVDEWRAATGRALPALRGESSFPPQVPPLMEWTIAMDVTVHEDDLRAALGLEPADPMLPCYSLAVTGYGVSLGQRIRELGRPALRLRADDVVLDLGDGAPVAEVRAGAYELTLALTGRRTVEQVVAFDWDGDPAPYLDILSAYATPPPRSAG